MVSIDVELNEHVLGGSRVAAIYPKVRVTVDTELNVDMDMLRQFKQDLRDYIDRGLNACLI